MGSKKESFTQSRNIFQTTQANINTPRNMFAARQQSYSEYTPPSSSSTNSISWESSYLDPGCINNYQLSWYGSKYGVHIGGNGPNFPGYGSSTGGFLCRGINDMSANTTVTCSSDRGYPSISSPVNCNTSLRTTQSMTNSNNNNYSSDILGNEVVQIKLHDNSMETDDFAEFTAPTVVDNSNNALDLTPSISPDIQNSMNSFEMITELKNDVDQLTDVNDPYDILLKLNSQYSQQQQQGELQQKQIQQHQKLHHHQQQQQQQQQQPQQQQQQQLNSQYAQQQQQQQQHQLQQQFFLNSSQQDLATISHDQEDIDMETTTSENCCSFDSSIAESFGGKHDNNANILNNEELDDIYIDNDYNIPSIKWPTKDENDYNIPSIKWSAKDEEPVGDELSAIIKNGLEELNSSSACTPAESGENGIESTDTAIDESNDTTVVEYSNTNGNKDTIKSTDVEQITFQKIPENIDQYLDENGDTKLHAAIHRQNISEALNILRTAEGTIISNLRNNSKEVPILLVLKRFADQCSLLLDKLLELRADVNVQDQSGNNIFHLILLQTRTQENCLSLLNVLFNHKGYKESYIGLMNKRNVDGFCPSHIATAKRYSDVVSVLKKEGADLNIKDHKGQRTCIVMAAEDRNWKLVKELIDMNVDVNIPTNANIRAVNYAIKCEQVQMIELLFKHHTDVYKWKENNTPKKIVQLVEKLIRKKRRQRQKKETQVERPA